MNWVDVIQNEPEWFALRSGRVGGSDAAKVMANYPKAFGTQANDLAVKLALEQINGEPIISDYSNQHMDRGREQEPVAKALYEAEHFTDVTNGGYFILSDIEGASPDGRVGDNGLIEIKSVIYSTQFATVKRREPDPAYKYQLFHELRCSGLEWIDYVSYCSTFPQGRQLFTYRIFAEDCGDAFRAIGSRMDEFRELVEDKKSVILRG
jgi:hypothetical protein